jgi:hypothetical protein
VIHEPTLECRPAVLPGSTPVRGGQPSDPQVETFFLLLRKAASAIDRVPVIGTGLEAATRSGPAFGWLGVAELLEEPPLGFQRGVHQAPFHPWELPAPRLCKGRLTFLVYRSWAWPRISPLAAKLWLWAELGIVPVESPATNLCLVDLPPEVFWEAGGLAMVRHALMKMDVWHADRKVEAWASEVTAQYA